MGFIFGLIKKLFKLLIYFIVFAAIVVVIPNLAPSTSFSRIEIEAPLAQVGPLALNNELDNIEKLYENKLLGPECFQIHKGEVYTGLATGEIVKLSPGGHVTFVAKIGKPCAGLKQEHICGRPLGLVIDEKNDHIYVADAYYGIWKVDLKSNKKTLLVSPNVEIEGQKPKLFNFVALDSKGNLFFTDSSADYNLHDGALSMLSDPNGRLFQYDAARNESKVLLDKLWFANGIVVSPDDQFLVVAETTTFRLIKYYINGPKKGKKEVFISGLPGTPDNLRALPDGAGLQAALYAATAGGPEPLRSLAGAPLARKFLSRAQHLVQSAFHFLNQHFPHVFFEDVIYAVGHFKSLSPVLSDYSGLIHIDWDGKVIASYYHTEGKNHVSDAILFNNKIYLGSPHGQNYVGSVPAPPLFVKAFTPKNQPKPQEKKELPKASKPDPAKVEPAVQKVQAPKTTTKAPKTTPPPVKTTPKPPTTTTPPPTTTTRPPTTTPPPTTTTRPPTTTTQPPKTTTQPPKTTTQPPKTTTQAPKTAEPVKPTAEKKVNAASTSPPAAKEARETKPKVKTPTPAKPVEQKQQAKPAPPKDIPITEEIPSDTIKPSKETLKVIMKEGPANIPNPEL